MKRVKKWLCIGLTLALVGSLCGCGGDEIGDASGVASGDTPLSSAASGDTTQENGMSDSSVTTTSAEDSGDGTTDANTSGNTQYANTTTAGTTKAPSVETSQAPSGSSAAVGTKENPVSLILGSNTVTLNGSGEYYYTWTATNDGALVLELSGASKTGWTYQVSNLTAGAEFTKTASSDDESTVSTAYVSVFKGDQIQITVNTATGTAGKVTVTTSLQEEWGTETSSIPITIGLTNYLRIPAGKTVYFSGRTQNTTMVLTGASGSVLKFDGDSYEIENGKLTVKMPKSEGGKAEVLKFTLTNNTGKMQTYSVTCNFPVGTTDNPAKASLGSNSVQIEAGSQYGYVYEWTASAKGTVTISMTGNNWHYEILNINTMVQEQSTSDLDEPVKETTIAVKKGQVVRITINTGDGKAGKVTFNFNFN